MGESGQTGATRVGRYALLESLGIGGMGEVHRARAYAAAGVVKDVCIKRIRAERLSKPGATDRFIAEARLSMRLAHGNIVPVFDFGRAGQEYYLAMEWVDGADMRAILEDAREHAEPFAPEVAAHVVAEVARALAYAHSLVDGQGRAVVHRDVKPGNVLVSRAGDVKLTDFGVATFADEAGSGVGGTPAYMAPEQRAGRAVDARTDVWALGVVLIELTTGLRVGETPGLVDFATARIPDKLRDVARRALREAPNERYAGARDLATALEQFVSEQRAGGAPAPREDLAARAVRAAANIRTRAESDVLGADTSFLRDGADESFESRMSHTVPTQSTRPPAPAITVPEVTVPEVAVARRSSQRAARETPAAIDAAPRPARSRALVVLAGAAAVGGLVLFAALGLANREPDTEPGRGRVVNVPVPERPAPAVVRPSSVVAATADRAAVVAPPPSAPASPAVVTEPASVEPTTPSTLLRPRGGHHQPVPSGRAPASSLARPPQATAVEPALVSINARPWADVSIDGRPVGTTPLFSLRVAPGTHTVRFTNEPLGATRESELTVAPGEQRSFVVDLR